MRLNYTRLLVEKLVRLDSFGEVLLWGEWGWRKATSPMLWLIIVLLVLEMDDIKLLFGLLKLTLETGDLFLIWLFTLLQLDLKQCQLLHGFLHSLFILIQHWVCSPVLWLKGFINILQFNYLFLEVLESQLEIVSLSFYQLQLFLENTCLILFLFLKH